MVTGKKLLFIAFLSLLFLAGCTGNDGQSSHSSEIHSENTVLSESSETVEEESSESDSSSASETDQSQNLDLPWF